MIDTHRHNVRDNINSTSIARALLARLYRQEIASVTRDSLYYMLANYLQIEACVIAALFGEMSSAEKAYHRPVAGIIAPTKASSVAFIAIQSTPSTRPHAEASSTAKSRRQELEPNR